MARVAGLAAGARPARPAVAAGVRAAVADLVAHLREQLHHLREDRKSGIYVQGTKTANLTRILAKQSACHRDTTLTRVVLSEPWR